MSVIVEPQSPAARWRSRALRALPPLLAVGVYVNALNNPFVSDDRDTVVLNPGIRELFDLPAIVAAALFRPLEALSFAIDYALWGPDPFGYHLTNLLLHVANVMLLFVVTSRAVRDAREILAGTSRWCADPDVAGGLAAALFAVHPLLTEAVGYVSARGDLLVTMLMMLALLAARKGFLLHRTRWIGLALTLFGLGLASKEVGIMLPFVILVYDRLLLRTVPPAGRRLWRVHAPMITVSLLAAAARAVFFVWIESRAHGDALQRMAGYLAVQLEVVWRYVLMVVAPISLSIFHEVGFNPRRSILGAGALLLAVVLLFVGRRRVPVLALGVAWFFVLLVPSSSVMPLQHTMAEHRVYGASGGLFVAAGWGVASLLVAARRFPPGLRFAPHVAVVAAIVALSVLTVARNGVWADPVTLWRDAADKTPRWRSKAALADALREHGRCREAIPVYREAIERAPRRLMLRLGLHNCLVEEGRINEAREIDAGLRAVDPDFRRRCEEMREVGRVSVDQCIAAFADGHRRYQR